MRVKLEKDGSLLITAETVAEAFALQATHPVGADPKKIVFDMRVLGAPMADMNKSELSPEPTEYDVLEFCFEMKDIIISLWNSKPRGGFSIQPENGIKVTHGPSGKTATCEDFKSSHMNRHMALIRLDKLLRSTLNG